MLKFLNNIDGSKFVIAWAFLLALAAVVFIGIHILIRDGQAGLAEIGFLEGIIQSVLYSAAGISTVHVVTGAVASHKMAALQAKKEA